MPLGGVLDRPEDDLAVGIPFANPCCDPPPKLGATPLRLKIILEPRQAIRLSDSVPLIKP